MVWHVKIVVGLIVVFAALGLSVSSVGLWVILLSVKLPLWIVAVFSSGVQMTWATIRKVALKTVTFFSTWLALARDPKAPAQRVSRAETAD